MFHTIGFTVQIKDDAETPARGTITAFCCERKHADAIVEKFSTDEIPLVVVEAPFSSAVDEHAVMLYVNRDNARL